jgi:hypothetical protein
VSLPRTHEVDSRPSQKPRVCVVVKVPNARTAKLTKRCSDAVEDQGAKDASWAQE